MRAGEIENGHLAALILSAVAKVHLNADADAIHWLRLGLDANRNYAFAHFNLAAGLARLGELGEARAAVQAGLALDPSFTIRRFREHMRTAGVLEG